MSTESIGFDVENPALNEYIRQRVQQEMEQYTLNKELDFLASPNDAQTSPGSMKDSMPDKFVAKLVEKLKNTEAYKESIYEAIEEMCEDQNSTNNRSTDTMKQLLAGLKINPNEGELEQDVFSMMILSQSVKKWKEWILVWVYGCFAYVLQITLGILVIMDQMTNEFGETDMGIPIKDTAPLRIAKALAIVLSIFTQTDFLMSLKIIMLFWKGKTWKELLSDGNENPNDNGNIKNYHWWIYVLLPHVLKGAQGLLILVTGFILIIQSENIVDLLKDYSALFVISETHKLLFNFADRGYVGSILSQKALEVKVKKYHKESEEKGNKAWLTLAPFLLGAIFFGYWINIALGQADGKYVEQAYPLCPLATKFNQIQRFIDIIGDGTCQFPQGKGTNVIECGWDGGDCDTINERYPNCTVNDFALLGDETCNGFAYNNLACGFDDGDCILLNQQKREIYPMCAVENIGWIEDGFCDEENNVDDCSFDGNDCVPVMDVIGDRYDEWQKWIGGVLGHDGSVYGIPYEANKILKIDPSQNATNPTALVGDNLGDKESKWNGGVVGSNGIIYGVPSDAKSILTFNTTSEKTQLIAENHELLLESSFADGVLANNGMIYFTPSICDKVVKFDPSNLEDPLIKIGDDLGNDMDNIRSGVLGSDGNIYAMPYHGNQVLKIKVADDTTSFIGDEYSGLGKWSNGVLAKDGHIYACPYEASQILQINIESQTTNLVGPDFGDGGFKWSGFVEGEDGFLYGMPFLSNELLRFDPINHKATLISFSEDLRGILKYDGGVRADNGFIYGIPYVVDQVLSIAPVKLRP